MVKFKSTTENLTFAPHKGKRQVVIQANLNFIEWLFILIKHEICDNSIERMRKL